MVRDRAKVWVSNNNLLPILCVLECSEGVFGVYFFFLFFPLSFLAWGMHAMLQNCKGVFLGCFLFGKLFLDWPAINCM